MPSNKFIFVRLLVGVLSICSLASQGFAEDKELKQNPPEAKSDKKQVESDKSKAAINVAKENDEGGFTLSFVKPEGEDEQSVYSILKDDDTFQKLLDTVNKTIALPTYIPVRFVSCGQANAFYNPEKGDISMCYELFLEYLKILNDPDSTDEEVGEKVIQAATFLMFHEMGHALVHKLELPITGKEEDAVDDFASVLSLRLDEEGEKIVVSSIQGFAAWADQEGNENLHFEDEHSFSGQRFYSIACVLYGSDVEKYAEMVSEDFLPEARAARCPAEYKQKYASWTKLLQNHLKT